MLSIHHPVRDVPRDGPQEVRECLRAADCPVNARAILPDRQGKSPPRCFT